MAVSNTASTDTSMVTKCLKPWDQRVETRAPMLLLGTGYHDKITICTQKVKPILVHYLDEEPVLSLRTSLYSMIRMNFFFSG
jgi:hypothetical protein